MSGVQNSFLNSDVELKQALNFYISIVFRLVHARQSNSESKATSEMSFWLKFPIARRETFTPF